MNKNEFIIQAALKLISSGVTNTDAVEMKARKVAEQLEIMTEGIFDDTQQAINPNTNLIDIGEHNKLQVITPYNIECKHCIDFEACQGRRCNPISQGPCSELKIAVIAREP